MDCRAYRPLALAAALLPVPALAAPPAPARKAQPKRAQPAAAARWDQQVAAHKTSAAKHAAARNWDLALRDIGAAKRVVEEAQHDARGDVRMTPRSPEYRKEMEQLVGWLGEQRRLAFQRKANYARSVEQFQKKKEALDRKYGISPKAEIAAREKLLTGTAQYTLELAALDELAARYHTGKGDRESAALAAESALEGRLDAYQKLNRAREAAETAEKIAALSTPNVDLLDGAARFFQRRKQFDRSAEIWNREIDLIQTGRAKVRMPSRRPALGRPLPPQDLNKRLPTLYRQLAFALSRQGKTDEANRALQKARELQAAR